MTTSARIGVYLFGLAILGGPAAAQAQTRPADDGSRSGAISSRAGESSSSSTAARRPSAAPAGRTTAARRQPSAYTRGTVGGYASRGYTADDPLRPYSARARREAAAISPTRVTEASAPPPEARPQPRYNYYPDMRGGMHPNANIPRIRSHCIPSRSSVLTGKVARNY